MDGKLSATETVRLTEWYSKNWDQHFKCPVCQSDKWQTGGHVVEMRPFRQGGFAFIQVISDCGYTIFLNASVMGVLDPLPVPAAPEKKDG